MKTTLLLLAGLVSPMIAHTEETRLSWVESGFSAKMGYYRPQRATLTQEKPALVKKMPEGVKEPRFATLQMGPKAETVTVTLLLDESSPGKSKLWVDSNGNGDLTDDPAPEWTPRTSRSGDLELTQHSGHADVAVRYGDATRRPRLALYRFDKDDPKRKALASVILYYREFGLEGKVEIGGKSLRALLSEESAKGDFTGADTVLGLDVSGDGKIDSRRELFKTGEPFNIGGVTYEIADIAADGSRFQIVKSEKKAEEREPGPDLGVGRPAISFEDKTTEGKPVRFPQDYKGKLVLLNFWATWCGPCLAKLPALTKAHDELHTKGFEILGVSLDNEKTMPGLAKFTKDKGMAWPQICDGQAWKARLALKYDVHGIPAAFLVDGETGLIVASGDDLTPETLRGTIERCLANLGKPPKPSPAKAPTTATAAESPLVKKVLALASAGKTASEKTILAQMNAPRPAPLALAPVATAELGGREIARRAAASYLRMGWVYQCTRCNHWHTNLAGAYAITKDAAVTAQHVLEPPTTIKPGTGHFIAVRGEEDVLSVSAVLLSDAPADTAIVRIADGKLAPLPLSADAQPGDEAYCLSDPRGVRGYFSTGMVNRLYARADGSTGDPRLQRMNVSTDWAPGSSGAAVLDVHGNAIAHVTRIQPITGGSPPKSGNAQKQESPPTVMTLHEAVPARTVLSLIEKMNARQP